MSRRGRRGDTRYTFRFYPVKGRSFERSAFGVDEMQATARAWAKAPKGRVPISHYKVVKSGVLD